MKKLLIDVNSIVPYYISGRLNGIGRTTLELLQALSKVDNLPFDIMLYSQNMKGVGGRNTGLPFKNKHLYLPHREQMDKLLARFPIREWLTGYDIMHIPHNFEYVHRPDKCIVTIHDALFMKMQELSFNHDVMKRILPPFAMKCCHIITCSEASKMDIVETMDVNPDKISVIYWGVKHESFYPLELSRQEILAKLHMAYPQLPSRYFLSVSCNAERKRTHNLISAYIKLCEHYPLNDLILVWGNPPQWLLDKVNNSKAAKRIHFLKNVTDDTLALLYNAATASFNPSSYEGFGLPILEAMACGTPVVTCNNSSLGELGSNAVIYLDEPVEDSLLNVMEDFENQNIDVGQYIKCGIKRASEFNWDNAANETIKVYEKCLAD